MAVFFYFGIDLGYISEPYVVLGVISFIFMVIIMAYVPIREVLKK